MEIIAEIGQNHNGDINLALKLIKEAADNGADVAKFQLYDAKKLFIKKNNPWYEYNCKTELTRDDVKLLFNACKKNNIEFMASVFDTSRIEWLEELKIKRYKIASRSIYDTELISALIKTDKPLIASLGWWKESHLPSIKNNSTVDFLYCISEYPTALEKINFKKISFDKYSGFSDHTIGNDASMIALSRGAKIIERHFTLDRQMYGPDHECSMTPNELSELNKFRLNLKKCLYG